VIPLGIVAAATPRGIIAGPAWDPSAKHSAIELTNNNRTARGTDNGGGLVRSLTSKSSGKWYAEVRLDNFSSAGTNGCGIIGLVTPGEPVSNWVGQGTGCAGLWRVGSAVDKYMAGTSTRISGQSIAENDVCMMAWDADNGLFWAGKNGTFMQSGNPATGANPMYSHTSLQGEHYLATSPRNNNNRTTLLATPTFTVPAGFTYWT
jgi:hypothetical protein